VRAANSLIQCFMSSPPPLKAPPLVGCAGEAVLASRGVVTNAAQST
jgi:hypothetical protein